MLMFLFICFTTVSVLSLCSVDDKMINECGACGGVSIGKGTEVLGEIMLLCSFIHHTWYDSKVRELSAGKC
jgi:hypothetical protein